MFDVIIRILVTHLLFGLAGGLAWSQLSSHVAALCWMMLGLGYLLWRKLDHVHTAIAEERRAQKLEFEGRWFWKGTAGLMALGVGLATGGAGVRVGARDGFWTELVSQPVGRLESAAQGIKEAISSLDGHGTRAQAELVGGLLKIEELQRGQIHVLEGLSSKVEQGQERIKAQEILNEHLNATLQSMEQTQRRLQETLDRIQARPLEGGSR